MSFENQPEQIERTPSKEELVLEFNKFINGFNYKETKSVIDSMGVECFEVEVSFADGEKIELNYQRPKNYDGDNQPKKICGVSGSIHVVYFDANSIPYTGKPLADFIDGSWKYIENDLENKLSTKKPL